MVRTLSKLFSLSCELSYHLNNAAVFKISDKRAFYDMFVYFFISIDLYF